MQWEPGAPPGHLPSCRRPPGRWEGGRGAGGQEDRVEADAMTGRFLRPRGGVISRPQTGNQCRQLLAYAGAGPGPPPTAPPDLSSGRMAPLPRRK